MTNQLVGIVVVGYNSQGFLRDCFKSIFESSYKNIQVYFVDNNSSDQSLEFLSREFPRVKQIASRKNLGFAAGNNLGAKKALKEGCQYLLLMNPDTTIDSECLRNLMQQAKPDTLLQPLILLHEKGKTNLLNTSGNVLHFLGFSYVNDYRRDYRQVDLPGEIAVGSGAALLIPAAVIKNIGLFHKEFFMYHEDVDFSWRARIAGYHIRLTPSAKIWHKYHFSRNAGKYYFAERNRWLFVARNYQIRSFLLFAPMFIFSEVALLIFSVLGGFGREKIRANWDALRQLIPARRFYRQFLDKRVCADKDLYRYFSGKVSFSEVESRGVNLFNWFSMTYWRLIRFL